MRGGRVSVGAAGAAGGLQVVNSGTSFSLGPRQNFGEGDAVVTIDARGRTRFRALQQRFHLTGPAEIRAPAEQFPAAVFLFDLLWLDGRDLTGEPLAERKRLLREAVAWSYRVRWTELRE